MLSVIRNIIGEQKFKRLRAWGYRVKFKLLPTLDQDQFKTMLREDLGLQEGDVVFVHTAFGKMNVDFSGFKILSLLQSIVGEKGTLLFPCWHFNFRAAEYLSDTENVFDVKKSRTVMGLVNELARRNKKAVRSLHPTNSVVAIGKLAEELTQDHHKDVLPNGAQSPFFKITQHKGKIVGLGEPANLCLSFVHCVEDILGDDFPYNTREKKLYEGRVIDHEGNETMIKTLAAHADIKNRNLTKYFDHLSVDALKRIKKGGTEYFVADADQLYKEMVELTKKGITIYSWGAE